MMFSNKSASMLGLRAAFAALLCLFLPEVALGQSVRIWYVAPTAKMTEAKDLFKDARKTNLAYHEFVSDPQRE